MLGKIGFVLFGLFTPLIAQQQLKLYFYFTGSVQYYTVPTGVTRIDATVCGALGGGSYGGKGQCINMINVPVNPGQTIYIYVGGNGEYTGGFNGGAAGSGLGYGGGGASDLRTISEDLTSRFIVAAGGGGAGYNGNGGWGNYSNGYGSGYGGLATMSAGGAGGKYYGYPNGDNGGFGLGGAAVSNGGGGGGGWYGGGGATYNGGGGGGSSFFSLGTKSSTATNYDSDGYIILTPYTEYTYTYTFANPSGFLAIPSDVTTINAVLTGAQGGSSATGQGGKGGYISATLTDSNHFSNGISVYVGLSNGYPGGGVPTTSAYCREGGLGGGCSYIYYYAYGKGYINALVAGGGGGAGFDPYCKSSCNSSSINGGAGGKTGYNGLKSPAMATSYGGKGALVSSGGAGGYYNSSFQYGYSGGSFRGGSPAPDGCGGGGGGGYYGGGGGSYTGGGGGSNYYYASVSSNVTQQTGMNEGNGSVTITFWSAMNSQPSLTPTPSPASGSSDSSSTNSTNAGPAAASVIVPILVIAACCYYCNKKKDSSNPSQAMVPVVRANPAYVSHVSKITCAVETMTQFLSAMMSSRDRCSVVSFSNTYIIRENLSSSSAAISSLNACRFSVGGGTHLYDAAVKSVMQFVGTADRSRPWILIILTDGEDTGSQTKPSQLIEVLNAFNKPASNFVFMIGLGQSLQDRELRRICDSSKSMYLRAHDLETMKLMFALIALVVVEQRSVEIAAIQAEGVEAIFARARTARAVATIPIDIIVLLDTSGSMNESS